MEGVAFEVFVAVFVGGLVTLTVVTAAAAGLLLAADRRARR